MNPSGKEEKKNDGGSAFPLSRGHFNVDGKMLSVDWDSGMTLRDYFAGKALNGLLSNRAYAQETDLDKISMASYEVADFMLKARAL